MSQDAITNITTKVLCIMHISSFTKSTNEKHTCSTTPQTHSENETQSQTLKSITGNNLQNIKETF